MRKVFEIGGIVAAAVLVAFGVAAIVMGVNGRSTVQSSLKLEQIVGSPDMTPAGDHRRGARRPACRDVPACRPVASPASRSTPVTAPAHSRATCGSTRSRRPAA